jgi:hypothetical protein
VANESSEFLLKELTEDQKVKLIDVHAAIAKLHEARAGLSLAQKSLIESGAPVSARSIEVACL